MWWRKKAALSALASRNRQSWFQKDWKGPSVYEGEEPNLLENLVTDLLQCFTKFGHFNPFMVYVGVTEA